MLQRTWLAEARPAFIVLSPQPRYAERVVICDSRRFDTLLAIPR